jgi:hypothetical protein
MLAKGVAKRKNVLARRPRETFKLLLHQKAADAKGIHP